MAVHSVANEMILSSDGRWLLAFRGNFNITKISWDARKLGFHYKLE